MHCQVGKNKWWVPKEELKHSKARTIEINNQIKRYRNREEEILFMDLREVGIPFEKKFTQFSDDNIKIITETFHHWQQADRATNYADVPEFCYSASIDVVKSKDYSLVPSKYIEFVNRDENIDFNDKMEVLQSEFSDLLQAETKSKADLLTVFKELGYEIKL